DPATGPGLRVVLLRHTDGSSDLVVIAHRAVLADPLELLRALLVDPPAQTALPASPVSLAAVPQSTADELRARLALLDRTRTPDWALGEPGAAGTAVHAFSLPGGGELPAALTATAALGLVLARWTGSPEVVVGLDARDSLTFTADPAATMADYLVQVGKATPVPGLTPFAGLVVDEPAERPGTQQLPFLAPVHPLSLHLTAAGDRLTGRCHHRPSVVGGPTVTWFTEMLATAHAALLSADPDTAVGELALFDDEQRRRLALLGGLGRSLAVPAQRIEQAVGYWAEQTPDAPAVSFAETHLTYRQLDQLAEQQAAALRGLGVRPGRRVGVCLDRSLDLVVSLLAVLKAGAAYLPMDAAYPPDRLRYTVQDAELALVITDAADFPPAPGVRLVHPSELTAPTGPAEPSEPALPADPAGPLSPDDPAYVIYTSGSTGRPKGVVVPHRNVAALLAATRADFGLGGGDVWTLFHSSAFDFSVWEIWGCLTTGGRLVVVPFWASRDPEQFARLLREERVTVLSQTPSAFAQLTAAEREQPVGDALRLVVFGGEPLDTRPLLAWLDRHPAARCRLVNMFGITETTVHVTAQTVTRREALTGSRSVGAPLPGWHLAVLDPAGRELPPGVAGEIYVGGAGVAGQYLHRPELTAERFVTDPDAPGPRYRSGDRGRLLPDGRLEHLGRLDSQVKLRGFRIELGEIRARLLDSPQVAAAAVVLRRTGDDAAGARLDAYVVLQDAAGSTEEVRRHAAAFLPAHMVPSTITALPVLPLTPNGKVDTARLPEPLEDGDPAPAEAGAGDLESRLKTVWERTFGFRVGLDDDFFTLGGNSLLGVRLLAAVRAADLPAVRLPDLYRHRTVRTLTAHLAPALPR
ncbi:amino acid adenylation protein, partial [Streptomyces tateyamensis]